MRRLQKPAEDNDINLTPMLDVVFILLIFFIVTTSFVKETGIDINRPSAATAEKKPKGNILIAIKPNDEIWIDNRSIDVRAVRANIQRLKARSPQSSVIIQSDKDARTGILVKVMDQIRLAGVQSISIAASVDSR
ncbi:MAG TPA: biopolymer transporter ExbD [Gammaproteobacteria bacterium]|jgi:biopolymer transport protein ExbD|nr:biopolymer transporter ExbD [Gammaproteobacteria bacterium]